MSELEAREFDLPRDAGRVDGRNNPIVERAVDFKLQGAQRMGNSFDGVGQTPDEQAKNTPLVDLLNPEAIHRYPHAKLEASLTTAEPGEYYQFERLGYFSVDPVAFVDGRTTFYRSVSLKDSWKKASESK